MGLSHIDWTNPQACEAVFTFLYYSAEEIGETFGRWYGMYKREHPYDALPILNTALIEMIDIRGEDMANVFLEQADW